MEAGFRIILVSFFLVCFGLTYTYKLPLHFIAKVKVIKEKEEVCSKCFHTFICYFVSFLGANVILFFKKQTFYELFLLNFFFEKRLQASFRLSLFFKVALDTQWGICIIGILTS